MTFLSYPDIKLSATVLNWQRLLKQRTEAYQILLALEHLRILARIFGFPDYPVNIETSVETTKEWISQITSRFRAELSGVWIQEQFILIIPNGQAIPHRPASRNNLYIQNDQVYEVRGKSKLVWTGRVNQCVLPGQQFIRAGFKDHTAVRMWLGFEDYLRYYLDIHIQEWIRRGYQNNMKFQWQHDIIPPVPSWGADISSMILGCRRSLIWKELTREEKPWYIFQDDFVSSWVYPHLIERFRTEVPNLDFNNPLTYQYLLQFGPPEKPEYTWV